MSIFTLAIGIAITALVGIGVSQLSTLFMQIRGGASSAAMAGPAVLLVLAVIYWFIRT